MDLQDYRKQIDEIDDQLVKLFAQRMEVSEGIASYKKIKKKEQTLCRLVSDGYRKIYEYEKQDGSSVNVISELFGELLQDLVVYLAGDYADDNVKNLAFNLGKWIYVIDALDDFDKDVKKGEYNPFKKEFPLINTKKQLLTEKREYLEYTFGDILSEIEYSHKKIKYYFNHDFIDNVLQKGLLVETKKIMEK